MSYELTTVRPPNMDLFPGTSFSRPGKSGYSISGMENLRICMYYAEVLDMDGADNDCEYPNPRGNFHEMMAHYKGEKLMAEGTVTQEEWDHFFEDAEKLRVWRSKRSLDPDKVLKCKFTSNDGWFVVPEECMLISEAMGRLMVRMKNGEDVGLDLAEETGWDGPECLSRIRQWQLYNFVASQSGGYEVW